MPDASLTASSLNACPLPELTTTSRALLAAARRLSDQLDQLDFPAPVAHVYNPLGYAWAPQERYVRRFGAGPKQAVFLGMNPGPFGMMQTGVPFGEVAAVRDWMGICDPVGRPASEHPKRPIDGFGCRRSEVSGRRLWGWAAERFGSAQAFFERYYVLNYCPLGFLEASGRNYTPDKLPADIRGELYRACDEHLAAAIQALAPRWAIGVGGFAQARLAGVLGSDSAIRIGQILHPSPASPMANRGWAEQANRQLTDLGL